MPVDTAEFAEISAHIREGLVRQGFMAHVGAEIEMLEPGICAIGVPFQKQLAQPRGFFHGGLIGVLVDAAGAYSALTLIEPKQSVLTAEFKVSLIAPAKGERIRAISTVVRAGQTLITAQVEVLAVDGAMTTKCAIGIVTLIRLADRGDEALGGKRRS